MLINFVLEKNALGFSLLVVSHVVENLLNIMVKVKTKKPFIYNIIAIDYKYSMNPFLNLKILLNRI